MNKIKFILSVSIILAGLMAFTSKNVTFNNNLEKVHSGDSTIVIATINSGSINFVANPNLLKSDWQYFISNNPDLGPCIINNVLIHPDSTSTNFYLVASGSFTAGGNFRSVIELDRPSATCLTVGGTTVTCTTSDCSSEQYGCYPMYLSCNPCGNKGKCTKTVNGYPTDIFTSIPTGNCSN